MGTRKIEILFPLPIELPDGFEMELDVLINKACKKFEAENSEYKMWLAGHGSKTLWREPLEPDYDDEVYKITVSVKNADPSKNSLVRALAFPYEDCHYGKCKYNPYKPT